MLTLPFFVDSLGGWRAGGARGGARGLAAPRVRRARSAFRRGRQTQTLQHAGHRQRVPSQPAAPATATGTTPTLAGLQSSDSGRGTQTHPKQTTKQTTQQNPNGHPQRRRLLLRQQQR